MYVINFSPSCDISNFVSIVLTSTREYVNRKIGTLGLLKLVKTIDISEKVI